MNRFLIPLGSALSGSGFRRSLKAWNAFDRLSETELLSIQEKRLSKLLEHSLKNVPYYRDLDLGPNAVLEDFPILDKMVLRDNAESLIAEGQDPSRLLKHQSSGSSGVQSVTYSSKEHRYETLAIQMHWWMWGGYEPGKPIIQTGISPNRGFVKSLKDFFFRVKYLEAFTLSREKSVATLDSIRSSDEKYLAGYPSAFYEMARYASEAGKDYRFDLLISLGDKLFDHYLPWFEKVYGNPRILNTYGCSEGLQIGCKFDLPYYYIMSPHVFVEIVDDQNQRLPTGERGHILVTCLTNLAMPLIRYKVGDIGALLPKEAYPSERAYEYPLLKELTGRESDIIRTPAGDSLVVHSFTGILEYFQEIRQYQVVQNAPDSLQLHYIGDKNRPMTDAQKKKLENKLGELLKGSMELEFVEVDHIAPSPSGKPEIIKVLTDDL